MRCRDAGAKGREPSGVRTAIAIGLLAATALAGAILLWPEAKAPVPPQPGLVSEPLAGDERPLRPVGPEEGIPPPSFDIVRIEPSGVGAVSGRAPASARVLLKADGATVASAEADSRGEWALFINRPLTPGDHALSLLAALQDGRGIVSREAVIVSIAEHPVGRPLVVLTAPGLASEVMQAPGGPSARSLSIEAIDLDAGGGFLIGGRAEPGMALNLYLDNDYIGDATADDEGRWSLRVPRTAEAGAHRLRLDALAADEFGAQRVAARLDVPLTLHSPAKSAERQPGLRVESAAESWLIEGEGPVSTLIFSAAAGHALDPSVAYPGQRTQSPAAATPAATR
jgi:hypothetical protein